MMQRKDAEEVPCSSGMSSGASLGRGLQGPAPCPAPASVAARRLTSLRTRDLTLGGALKKAKKTFEPNVNAVRKSKDEFKEEIQVTPRRERKQRDDRRRESRGRRKEKPQTIQSHSIFEQGPADTLRKTGWVAAPKVGDATAPPKCGPVKQERNDSDDDDELLRKLQRDDFICDPDLKNDAKLNPIQLPLCQTSTTPGQEKPPLLGSSSTGPQVGTGHSGEQPSLVEILQGLCLSSEEELFFMQLPDCMPARAQKAELNPEARFENVAMDKKQLFGKAQVCRLIRATPSVSVLASSQESPSVKCSPVLSEFPEGFLGKIQIRKSGKMEMKLGNVVMDITDGAALSFLQQLVSVNLSDGKTGDMVVLGNIQHKLVLSPNFQTLLEQSTEQ
ncbi:DNA-directed RNA polymerase III subunit RPC4-like isoform X2 [Phyllopteryx taeniolatus]|uniref:DNA-directed RNA polymerase III subunit RPC4-like isoform X2 n=1 Tax=Phyllopteryx taeniolatus TaxID=161469 RepID=UPI002AD28C8F|nr:DNA-directed RNA polymerase III subunit RPC4-like isoform X2 [Phyllopteryx taeniolatus]